MNNYFDIILLIIVPLLLLIAVLSNTLAIICMNKVIRALEKTILKKLLESKT